MKKEEQINKIFDSLEGITPAGPRPFFFGRLEARMERQRPEAIEAVIQFISRPPVAIAAVLLIIVINAWSIFSITPATVANQVSSNELPTVDEYMQMSPDVFELDKSTP